MSTSVAERLVNRLATIGTRRQASRRGFLAAATLSGAALAADPFGYLLKPQDAYASVCGTDASCGAGYSAFCCSINSGHNTCPPNTFAGGWWKADRSSFCGGKARYYIDCNAKPGSHFHCHCNNTNCDHRRVACNVFRYGQCNTQIHGTTAVVCRQISCRPPWELYPGKCGRSSATDNNTRAHNAPCLTKANTYPVLRTYPKGSAVLDGGHHLWSGHWLTSPDRHTMVYMHPNGNLLIRNNHPKAVWSSGTYPQAKGGSAYLRRSGELVILDRKDKVVWSSHSASSGATARMQIHNNGNLYISHGTHVVWQSRTHTP